MRGKGDPDVTPEHFFLWKPLCSAHIVSCDALFKETGFSGKPHARKISIYTRFFSPKQVHVDIHKAKVHLRLTLVLDRNRNQ